MLPDCAHCGEAFDPAETGDDTFCSDSCRAAYEADGATDDPDDDLDFDDHRLED